MVFDRQLTNSIAMQLDAGYLVAFEGSAGHSAALVWGQVARASDQLAQSVQAKPVVAPQPVTPVVDPAQGVDTAPSTGVAATEAGAGAAVGGDHPQLPPEPPQTSRWPLPMWLTALIGVILLLLLLGIGGWFFLTKMRPDLWDSLMSRFEQTSEPAPVAQQQPEPVPEPVTAPEPAAAPAPVPTPFERGRAAFDAGDCTVARDTLQQATDAGDLEALLFVPQQIDSRDFKPCLTEQPNDVAALRHLTAACGVDAERSRTALSELEAELTRLADRGDVTAGEVLRLAMPKARAACGL